MPDKPPKAAAAAIKPPPDPVEDDKPKRERPTQTKRPRGRPKDRKARLEGFIGVLAMPFFAAGDTHCAGVITANAPQVAAAWADLAQENKGVARALDKLLEGGAWGGVVIATGGMVLPILAHHNLYPKSLGVPFGDLFREEPPEENANGAGGPPGVVTAEHPPPPPPNPPTNG